MLYWGAISAQSPGYILGNRLLHSYDYQLHHIMYSLFFDHSRRKVTHFAIARNPFVERFIGTLRREMLNHVIVFSQNHLERLLREFIEEYYHVARPHQDLDGDTPVLQMKQPQILGPSKLISIPVLGGLHHRYIRVAA